MDEDEEVLTAIVCEFDEAIFRVNRAQALIFATCMIISVPVNKILLLLSIPYSLFRHFLEAYSSISRLIVSLLLSFSLMQYVVTIATANNT